MNDIYIRVSSDILVLRFFGKYPAMDIRPLLVHPAKDAERNEMPFGRDTPTGMGDLGPEPPVLSDAAYLDVATIST